MTVADAIIPDEEIYMRANLSLFGENTIAKARMDLAQSGESVAERVKSPWNQNMSAAICELAERAGNMERGGHRWVSGGRSLVSSACCACVWPRC